LCLHEKWKQGQHNTVAEHVHKYGDEDKNERGIQEAIKPEINMDEQRRIKNLCSSMFIIVN
jgi:hypothetical protein